MAEGNDLPKGSTKERYTFFYGSDTPFSQWHACKFSVEGVEYNCAEQYMMHQKALIFKDENMAKKIMATDSPKEQKAYGRKVSNFDPVVWNQKCRDVVREGNVAKFGQNERLWTQMAATDGTVLVEASPRDRIWGIGLGASNPKALNKMNWRGKNWLGYALTEVRTQLMQSKPGKGSADTPQEAAAEGHPQADSEAGAQADTHSQKKRSSSSNSQKSSRKSKKPSKS